MMTTIQAQSTKQALTTDRYNLYSHLTRAIYGDCACNKAEAVSEFDYTLEWWRRIVQEATKQCEVIVKVMDGEHKPCLCTPGHAGGHNPFSPNPFMLGVKTDAKK